MTVGLEIRNNDNVLQIDGMYQGWSLVEKRSVTTAGHKYSSSQDRTASVTYNGKLPIFAVKPLGVFSTVAIPWLVGANAWRTDVTFSGTATRTFDLYIFDVTDAPAAGPGIGIQVFNEAGKMVFDGTQPQMRFLDVINTLNAPGLNKDYPNGFLVAQQGYYFEATEKVTGGYALKIDSFRAIGNQLELGGPTYGINNFQGGYGDRNYLIINATGLP